MHQLQFVNPAPKRCAYLSDDQAENECDNARLKIARLIVPMLFRSNIFISLLGAIDLNMQIFNQLSRKLLIYTTKLRSYSAPDRKPSIVYSRSWYDGRG